MRAAPGAGKSTLLLQYLLEHSPVEGTIIVLQPRRVVVRGLAHYVARSIGESVGERVGYQIRGDSKQSQSTRLLFVTEAILARKLMADPELNGVGLVVFDEFHERNVHSDFGLALTLEVQQVLRDDIRLLVMSATLALPELEQVMSDAALVEVPGRQFPIDVIYKPQGTSSTDTRFDVSVIATVLTEAMASADGDILVFLPGQGEIQRCLAQLENLQAQGKLPNCHLFALYGAQSQKAQQQALTADPDGVRKVIIATNVAETSLTIEGIRIVIDSGLERSMVLDLATGIERLVLRQISKASATQRAGRAGRTSAGTCYRLWSEEVQQRLVAQRDPDILQRNVSDLVLASLAWGTPLHDLELLTQPRQAQLDVAYLQLSSLAAIDSGHGITEHGRALLQYPLDVRLAHMFIPINFYCPMIQHVCTPQLWWQRTWGIMSGLLLKVSKRISGSRYVSLISVLKPK